MAGKLRLLLASWFTAVQVAVPVMAQGPVGSGAAPLNLEIGSDAVGLVAAEGAIVGEAAELPPGQSSADVTKGATDGKLTKANAVYLVRLQDNGNLLGRLRITYPTGKSEPAAAKIVFEREGKKADWAETDEEGRFELLGVKPGAYVAKAAIATGETDFNVRVLPFNAQAKETEMLLDAAMTPTPEIIYDQGFIDSGVLTDCGGCGNCELCGMVVEEIVEPMMDPCAPPCDMGCQVAAPCGGGFSGGGCCGGGGGFGRGLGLLGLGGLATGITALALRDPDDPVASPAAP